MGTQATLCTIAYILSALDARTGLVRVCVCVCVCVCVFGDPPLCPVVRAGCGEQPHEAGVGTGGRVDSETTVASVRNLVCGVPAPRPHCGTGARHPHTPVRRHCEGRGCEECTSMCASPSVPSHCVCVCVCSWCQAWRRRRRRVWTVSPWRHTGRRCRPHTRPRVMMRLLTSFWRPSGTRTHRTPGVCGVCVRNVSYIASRRPDVMAAAVGKRETDTGAWTGDVARAFGAFLKALADAAYTK